MFAFAGNVYESLANDLSIIFGDKPFSISNDMGRKAGAIEMVVGRVRPKLAIHTPFWDE